MKPLQKKRISSPLYLPKSLSLDFLLKVYANKEEMMAAALEMAANIAAKSPVAVQGTKINLAYSREHSPDEGLDYIAR